MGKILSREEYESLMGTTEKPKEKPVKKEAHGQEEKQEQAEQNTDAVTTTRKNAGGI